jgi:hypothetical protein
VQWGKYLQNFNWKTYGIETFVCGYLKIIMKWILNRDRSVGIATGYGLDDREIRSSSPSRVKNFLFSKRSRPALGSTQSRIQWVQGALSPG